MNDKKLKYLKFVGAMCTIWTVGKMIVFTVQDNRENNAFQPCVDVVLQNSFREAVNDLNESVSRSSSTHYQVKFSYSLYEKGGEKTIAITVAPNKSTTGKWGHIISLAEKFLWHDDPYKNYVFLSSSLVEAAPAYSENVRVYMADSLDAAFNDFGIDIAKLSQGIAACAAAPTAYLAEFPAPPEN